MAELQERTRQLLLRLVFFGPPASGKAANLQWIHELLRPESRSRMRAYDRGPERTVSFDMTLGLPAAKEGEAPWRIQLTLSGCSSPLLKDTKIATVQAADAIAFVADGVRGRDQENREALRELEEVLRGKAGGAPPIVVQLNKHDHPDAMHEEDIEREWGGGAWPVFTASATDGSGVRETFSCLLRLAWEAADRREELSRRTGLGLPSISAAAISALRAPAEAHA